MSQQIPVAMVNQFHGDVEMLVQQKGSVLRACVRTEDQKGEVQFWDQIGPTEAVDITNRHGDSPQVDSDHQRRACMLQFFDWGDFIDKIDRVRILQDPTNDYTQNAVYALGRRIDRIIAAAFFADAKTGKSGTSTTSFTSTQVVDDDVKGEVNSFMGFEFVHTELVPDNGSTLRYVPVWAKGGMLAAISPDIETAVERRWDKRGSVYIYASAGAGATRMQEKKVVKIECVETI